MKWNAKVEQKLDSQRSWETGGLEAKKPQLGTKPMRKGGCK
jgi:hypothetical protein